MTDRKRPDRQRSRVPAVTSYADPLSTVALLRQRAITLMRFVTQWPLIVARTLLSRRNARPPTPYTRIDFIHVRKTAGTSVFNSFLSLGGDDPFEINKRIIRSPWVARSGIYTFATSRGRLFSRLTPHYFAYSHRPYWSLQPSNRSLTVTVLRDPVERVNSLYRYLRSPETDAGEAQPAQPAERELANGSLEEFVQRAPVRSLQQQLHMFSRDLDPVEAAENIRKCHTWFFSESFNAGLQHLSQQLGIALAAREDRRSRPSQLSEEQRRWLTKLLEPEYEMMALLAADPGAGFVGAFPDSCRRPSERPQASSRLRDAKTSLEATTAAEPGDDVASR